MLNIPARKQFFRFCLCELTSWCLLLVSAMSQIYSHRELEDQLSKIREMLSDDKHDWEHRVVAVRVLTHGGRGGGGGDSDGAPLTLYCLPLVSCS